MCFQILEKTQAVEPRLSTLRLCKVSIPLTRLEQGQYLLLYDIEKKLKSMAQFLGEFWLLMYNEMLSAQNDQIVKHGHTSSTSNPQRSSCKVIHPCWVWSKWIHDVAADAALRVWAAVTQLRYLHTVEAGASSWTTARRACEWKGSFGDIKDRPYTMSAP